MSVEEESKNASDEEEYDVHDPKCPRCLQHGAVLVDVDCPVRPDLIAIVAKRPEVDVEG